MKYKVLVLIAANLVVLTGFGLVGELIARYQTSLQNKMRPALYTSDSILGFRLKANYQTIYQAPGQPSVPIHISGQGFRENRTYAIKKPAGIFRILMLGDSFTQGDEVLVEQTFSKILESKLNQNSNNQTYQVINAGVRGSSPLQQYLWFKNEGIKFKPDLVILNFYLGNDITDILMFDTTATDVAGLVTQLKLKDLYVDAQGFLRRYQSHFSLCELSAFCRLYLRPKPVVTNWNSQAWQITRRHLLAINQLAQSSKSKFILTLIPQADLADDPVRQILTDFAHDHKIKLIDFFPYLHQSDYDSFDQHWNQAGHQLAAQVIYEYLLSL